MPDPRSFREYGLYNHKFRPRSGQPMLSFLLLHYLSKADTKASIGQHNPVFPIQPGFCPFATASTNQTACAWGQCPQSHKYGKQPFRQATSLSAHLTIYAWKAVAGASDASKRQLRYTRFAVREGATASPRFKFSVIPILGRPLPTVSVSCLGSRILQSGFVHAGLEHIRSRKQTATPPRLIFSLHFVFSYLQWWIIRTGLFQPFFGTGSQPVSPFYNQALQYLYLWRCATYPRRSTFGCKIGR